MAVFVSGIPAQAASVKAGATCTKVGAVSSSKGTQFKCTKVKAKKLWIKLPSAKVPSIPVVYSPPTSGLGPCDYDSSLTGYAAEYQNAYHETNRCQRALKIVEASLTSSLPKSMLSTSNAMPVEMCKLQQATGAQNNSWRGFPGPGQESNFYTKRHPSPNTVIQIVPIYSEDAPKGSNTPAQDYKYYFDFVTQYFNYINDGPGQLTIKIPDRYYLFPGSIAKYEVFHGNDGPKNNEFINAAIAAADQDIDFSKANYTVVVVPGGTPSGIIGQQGFGRASSGEGYITNLMVAQPATIQGPNNYVTPGLALPTMWLHEFYHPGLNLGDNHGGNSKSYDDQRGMGEWGLMSNNNGDLLTWQKWFLGFLQDNQVACLDAKAAESTVWIAPASVKTYKQKLIVVKTGPTKALVIESIRAKSINYKFEKERLGALVYEVDTSDQRHEYGYNVMYPDSRRPKPDRPAMFDAPLKLGESLIHGGVKITNVEWGDFGDVIKVEPIK